MLLGEVAALAGFLSYYGIEGAEAAFTLSENL
jgi:hypothetical protein